MVGGYTGQRMWSTTRGWARKSPKVWPLNPLFSPFSRPSPCPASAMSIRLYSAHALHSLVCCIYHAPRAVGESSSENDSSSSSGSDPDGGKDNDDDDDGRARMSGSRKGRRRRKGEHGHRHNHEGACGGGESSHSGKPTPTRRRGRGNAYETQPKVRAEEGRAKA